MLHTPAELAAALSLTVSKLRWLCYHTEAATRVHYVQFEVPKKSGGTRTLSAPHSTLAAAQEWVLASILSKLPTEEPAHGFVPGRSTLTNALPHAGKDVVVNVDLEQFFPSIGSPGSGTCTAGPATAGRWPRSPPCSAPECPRRKRARGDAVLRGHRPAGLPQGASTSPAASNQIARKLDRRVLALCKRLGFTYTRYADDLTFSAPPGHREKVGYLLARVRHIAADEGFTLNPKKTRVQRPEARQSVTGLVVNAAPAVPQDVVRRLRAILHRAKAEGLAAQNRDGHPDFRGWVEGMIAYVGMVKPAAAEPLKAALAALRPD
ncbi:MAG: reverse transcriptase family protein [Gemmataceae bacterium]